MTTAGFHKKNLVVAFFLANIISFGRGFSRCYLRVPNSSSVVALEAETSSLSSLKTQINRRKLLAGALIGSTGAGATIWQQQKEGGKGLMEYNGIFTGGDSSMNNVQLLGSIDEALRMIDEQCDRRFLHAVIASNYRLLYRGVTDTLSKKPLVVVAKNDPQMDSKKETPTGSDFLHALEDTFPTTTMDDALPSAGRYHLSLTNPKDTPFPQIPMSIWPLGSKVHFAWTENPQKTLWKQSAGAVSLSSSSKVIVDGIDCGKMSLEDALERPNGQVIVYTDSYLMVPTALEEELLARLKNSFLI